MAFNAVLLDSDDNVVTACCCIETGQQVVFCDGAITARQDIETGHKIARGRIGKGGAVTKYGVRIGSATRSIAVGEHVHLHNIKSDYIATFTRRTGSSS